MMKKFDSVVAGEGLGAFTAAFLRVHACKGVRSPSALRPDVLTISVWLSVQRACTVM